MAAGSRTYEMLWDCAHCGARKNLGLTHRHCPGCGAPQDASRRYFPAESEKVAVEDHVFVGADRQCGFCQSFSSRRAACCGHCGAPLDGAREAARIAEPAAAGGGGAVPAASQARPGGQGRARPRWPWVAGALALLGLVAALVFVFVFWKRDGLVDVVGHAWSREVRVERFGPVSESTWCDQLPSDARGVDRRQEVRSHRQVPDGEDCTTRRVDNGDGTFSEHPECRTRYRSEAVYDAKCYYTVDRWAFARSERAEGASLADPPRWPAVALRSAGQCVGCEREGGRTERYTVRFVEAGTSAPSACDFPEGTWRGFAVGSRWAAELSVVGDRLDCDSLRAP